MGVSDREIACAVDEILRGAGYVTWLQDKDFGHANFMDKMADGFAMVDGGAKLLALVSRHYFSSQYCMSEAHYPLTDDLNNNRERLIVFRVEECMMQGFLKGLRYVDLVPLLHDHEQLRAAVLGAIDPARFPEEQKTARFHWRSGRQILHPEIRAVAGFTGRGEEFAGLEQTLWRQGQGAPKAAITNAAQPQPGDGGESNARTGDNSTGTATALRGLGGVGKSVLAREYAWRNRARYHGVWWVRAEKTETLLDDLIALGTKLMDGLDRIEDRQAAAQMTLDHISQSGQSERQSEQQSEPWLILYDNVPDPETIRRLTPSSGAHVLITTRWADWHGEADEVSVGVFTPEVAAAFLLERARGSAERPDKTRAEAKQLAEDLGYLPLALAIARAQAWRMNWTFGAYREDIGELLQRPPIKTVDYPRSVAAAFSLALDQVLKTAPEAEQLMAIAAFFAPDDIPLDLIADDVMPKIAKGDAVAALMETSLVTTTVLSAGTPGISVHRLVQTAMRDRLGDGREEAYRLAKRLVVNSWPKGNDGGDPRYWPQIVRLLPHARAILSEPDGPDGSDNPALLLSLLAHYLDARADYNEAEPLMRRALAIDEASFGKDHPKIAIRLNNLAELLRATNRLEEAEPMYRRAVDIFRTSLGEDHPNTVTASKNLAVLQAEIASEDKAGSTAASESGKTNRKRGWLNWF